MADNTTFESSSVNSALTRIKNTLNYSLKENYGIEDPEITEKFLHLHGLDKSRFDFINNFETLIEKGIADESVDTNSNKCDKSITGFFSETAMPINKLVGYRYLYRKLKELYGKKRAKYLSGLMYDMSLMLADSTNILKPYCFSLNASKLVMEGRPFGSLPSGVPHRIGSYINILCEIIHQMSNHTAGALAIGSLFLDVAHVMVYREHKTLSDLQDPEYRKYIENSFQCFIHSVNFLSRNGSESPFTNVSFFGKPKLKALLANDNMGWYFDKEDVMDGIPEEALKDCGNRDWIDYIISIIFELQDIFGYVMDRGDVLHDNRPIEFPVCTVNFSRRLDENGNVEFLDHDYVEDFCKKHDIMRYNIYISEGMKVASCHDFNDILYYENEEGKQFVEPIGEFVTKRLSNGKTEVDIMEKLYVKGPDNERIPISGAFKLPNTSGKLIEFTFENGQVLKVTPDHKFRVKNNVGDYIVITAEEISKNPELYDF